MTFALALVLALASPEDGDDWIARGRALLDEGKVVEARAVFEDARTREPDALTPRVWILRTWLAGGRINDTLDAVDELVAESVEDAAIDYLYGMSWYEAAESKLRLGGGGESLTRNISDAIHHLRRATAARPDRYRDAYRPLAKLSWMSQRLDVAEPAARAATRYYPEDARVWHLRARIAHERWSVARSAPDEAERAGRLAVEAEDAYVQARDLLTGGEGRQTELLLCETLLRLGLLRGTSGDGDAVEALAGAVALRPRGVDYRELAGVLPSELFLQAVERGLEAFEADGGQRTETGPGHWWLGYVAFQNGELARAERSFVRALSHGGGELESAWYYLGRLRYVQRDYKGAVAALRSAWERDPIALFRSLDADLAFNVAMIDALASWCARERRAVDATIFYELSAEFSQTPEAWQRLGQFLTAEGHRLFDEEGPDSPLGHRSHLTASAAFARALELAPDSPIHLFEAAHHLHRVLGQDLGRAKSLYERARLEAGRRLARAETPVEESSRLRSIRSEAKRFLDELEAETSGD